MTIDDKIGKRILVVGCPGSGKSTFAKQLHEKTGIPLFHLDNLWWKPDRTHVTRDYFDTELAMILQGDTWILDGDYSRTFEARVKACDTVFFLDMETDVCLEGICGRIGVRRTDIPWVETEPDPELEELVRNYATTSKPVLLSLLEKYSDKYVIRFRTRKQITDWLNSL